MISVIVPVYNIRAHIENCIQSILKWRIFTENAGGFLQNRRFTER